MPHLCAGAGHQQRSRPLKSKQKLSHAWSVPCVASALSPQGNPVLTVCSVAQPGGKIPLNFGEFGLNKDCVILASQFGKECSKEALLPSNFPSAWALGGRGRGCWSVMPGINFSREAGAWTQTSVPLSAHTLHYFSLTCILGINITDFVLPVVSSKLLNKSCSIF